MKRLIILFAAFLIPFAFAGCVKSEKAEHPGEMQKKAPAVAEKSEIPMETAEEQTKEEKTQTDSEGRIIIKTPEIVRILEEEKIDFVGTTHSQTISIVLEDGRRFSGKYVQAEAGKYKDDPKLFDILNLVVHIKEKRQATDKEDWSVMCE